MTASTPQPDYMFDMAQRLLLCCSAQLAATPAGAPARAAVIPGEEVAWDDCECGQLTVHVLRAFPTDHFPIPKTDPPFTQCGAALTLAEFVVTILRCVPVQDDNGRPPKPEALSTAAQQDFADRWAVQRGVICCFDQFDPSARPMRLLGEQLAVGTDGQCAGSEQHVFVGFNNCQPCEGTPGG